jgi:hypothetical protein
MTTEPEKPDGGAPAPLWAADLVDWQVHGYPPEKVEEVARSLDIPPAWTRPFRFEIWTQGQLEGRGDPHYQIYARIVSPDGQRGEVTFEIQNGHARAIPYVSDKLGGLEDEAQFRTVPEFDENVAVLLSVPRGEPWPEVPEPPGAQLVWVVEGEHWEVPGVQRRICSTEAGARAEALRMVNIMRRDVGLAPDRDPDRYRESLKDVVRAVKGSDPTDGRWEDIRVDIAAEEVLP